MVAEETTQVWNIKKKGTLEEKEDIHLRSPLRFMAKTA